MYFRLKLGYSEKMYLLESNGSVRDDLGGGGC